jgi:hypothetical protein
MQNSTSQTNKGDILMEGEAIQSEDLVRERDFYRAKLDEATARIKTLEFDNAELAKRDIELTKRVSELASKGTYRPRPRRF